MEGHQVDFTPIFDPVDQVTPVDADRASGNGPSPIDNRTVQSAPVESFGSNSCQHSNTAVGSAVIVDERSLTGSPAEHQELVVVSAVHQVASVGGFGELQVRRYICVNGTDAIGHKECLDVRE